ncbi:MAG TPA: Glu-tRNA(Gln) amidotransferase subunit GatD, partial [Thermoplasmata archaeon]|nr:Glu-tRNA(Gln) amidotransferase subunit GatD [Thermoplasmata archaeon]
GRLEGVLMPHHEFSSAEAVVLKLPSGYNIGVTLGPDSKVSLLGKRSEPVPKAARPPDERPGKRITLLHTGGTIASRVDYRTGGVVASFTPEEMLELIPEVATVPGLGRLDTKLVANIFSDNMRLGHLNLIGRAVHEAVQNGAEGVVVTHGTDTMHYSAAGLAFMLENCPVPVLLVGSQRSSDRPSSDAATNLLGALRFLCDPETAKRFKGVGICMHHEESDRTLNVLAGTRARKMHSSRRDAFKPVNDVPVAIIPFPDGPIRWPHRPPAPPPEGDGAFRLRPLDEDVLVGILKFRLGTTPDEVRFYVEKGYDGLVLEGTGLGHVPIGVTDELSEDNGKIREELKHLIDGGCVVAITTQTINGRVDISVYSNGRDLLRLGVVGDGLDMTPETAYMKLVWLLSNHPAEEAKPLFGKNLRGEISERSDAGDSHRVEGAKEEDKA